MDVLHAGAQIGNMAGLRLDGTQVLNPSQHAVAGKAAMAFSQSLEQEGHFIHPQQDILEQARKLEIFAQKAEVAQKVLEKYMFGTDITRIGPVVVPVTPSVVSTYPVPAQDISVFKAEHLPYDPNAPTVTGPLPLPNRGLGAPPSQPLGNLQKAGMDSATLVAFGVRPRHILFFDFI